MFHNNLIIIILANFMTICEYISFISITHIQCFSGYHGENRFIKRCNDMIIYCDLTKFHHFMSTYVLS